MKKAGLTAARPRARGTHRGAGARSAPGGEDAEGGRGGSARPDRRAAAGQECKTAREENRTWLAPSVSRPQLRFLFTNCLTILMLQSHCTLYYCTQYYKFNNNDRFGFYRLD